MLIKKKDILKEEIKIISKKNKLCKKTKYVE